LHKIQKLKDSILALDNKIVQTLEDNREDFLLANQVLHRFNKVFDVRKYAAATRDNRKDKKVFYIICGWLTESDAKKLEEGIKQLAETAGQLGNISQAAANSEVFAKSLSNASEAVVSFTTKQQNLDEVSDNMIKSYKDISGALSNASEGAKQYASHTETLSKNVNAINSIYELELKQIQTQAEAISSQTNKFTSATSDIDKLFTLISNTAKDMEAYRHQTEKLAKQVSDLNNVYGNMLNAIRS